MIQRELDHAVAETTGESLREIRRRGFTLLRPHDVGLDRDMDDLKPQFVDWDALDAARLGLFPQKH